MSNGRNTTVLKIRVPDLLLVELKKRSAIAGIGFSVLARHFLQEKMGMPKS
jgi:hypothetical protein